VSVEHAGPAVEVLRDPTTIRERCRNVLEAGLAGRLRHFRVEPGRLSAVADRVAEVTRARYPDLAIPPHSRWRHLEATGVALPAAIAALPLDERARARLDFVVISVLLDAGAGPDWRYRDAASRRTFARSEGLAVASLRMFEAGMFSSDPSSPWRAEADALEDLDDRRIAAALQVSSDNPLVGFEGRLAVLRRLGRTMAKAPDTFGDRRPRLGNLLDALRRKTRGAAAAAPLVLEQILGVLAGIGPERLTVDGVDVGDTWPHPEAGGAGPSRNLVPFHKLSQWLVYSLVEPLEEAGVTVTALDQLTGLAEYRNGGLFVDLDVLAPRDPLVLRESHAPGSEIVVEWRALTVALLDRLAPLVSERLGLRLTPTQLLEGGTWAAGRALADARRGGSPPIRVTSDGTLF